MVGMPGPYTPPLLTCSCGHFLTTSLLVTVMIKSAEQSNHTLNKIKYSVFVTEIPTGEKRSLDDDGSVGAGTKRQKLAGTVE